MKQHVNSSGLFLSISEGFSKIEPDALRRMIAASSDLAVLLTPAGDVADVFVGAETVIADEISHWMGNKFSDTLAEDSHPKLEALLADASTGEVARWRQLNHLSSDGPDLPLRYSAVSNGSDGNILLLGRDLREVSQLQQRLIESQMTIEQDYERIRQIESRYRVLFETWTNAVAIISADTGKFIDANSTFGHMMDQDCQDLIGRSFASRISNGSLAALNETLETVRRKGGQKSVVLRLKHDDTPVWLDALLFRSVSESLVLCRLRPEDVPGGDKQTVSDSLLGLFHNTGDALVFTDMKGAILQANAAFLSLANVAMAERLKGVNLADFLGRSAVDLNVMLSNAEQRGRMSIYATNIRTEYSAQVPVEISTTFLPDQRPAGFGFVFRDVSRLEASRTRNSAISSEAVQHLIDLVGSTPLKELVKSTTDVVERLCIETAIKLTNNNRAAAAEMLGLSRQSLYVKLRKFDLVSSDEVVEDDS